MSRPVSCGCETDVAIDAGGINLFRARPQCALSKLQSGVRER